MDTLLYNTLVLLHNKESTYIQISVQEFARHKTLPLSQYYMLLRSNDLGLGLEEIEIWGDMIHYESCVQEFELVSNLVHSQMDIKISHVGEVIHTLHHEQMSHGTSVAYKFQDSDINSLLEVVKTYKEIPAAAEIDFSYISSFEGSEVFAEQTDEEHIKLTISQTFQQMVAESPNLSDIVRNEIGISPGSLNQSILNLLL